MPPPRRRVGTRRRRRQKLKTMRHPGFPSRSSDSAAGGGYENRSTDSCSLRFQRAQHTTKRWRTTSRRITSTPKRPISEVTDTMRMKKPNSRGANPFSSTSHAPQVMPSKVYDSSSHATSVVILQPQNLRVVSRDKVTTSETNRNQPISFAALFQVSV